VDAGHAAAWYQDRVFQNLSCKRIQVDEIWGFVGAKQKNAAAAKRKDTAYGDAWLWIATDADTKLVPSWFVGGRDSDFAMAFMDDLASRLANRVQLTSDGHKAYLEAVVRRQSISASKTHLHKAIALFTNMSGYEISSLN
jgi:IS1 family transposase